MSGGSFKGSTRTVQGTSLQMCIRITDNHVSGGSFKGSTKTVQGTSLQLCIKVTTCLEDPLREVLGQYKGHPLKYVLG